MSTFISFDGYEDGGHEVEGSIYNAPCKCGHKLYEHGFIRILNGTGFWVSQCCICPINDGKFTCSKFELGEK